MTAYFDEIGHMIADSLGELHEFAGRIGLKRCWFQHHGHPHYDLTTVGKRCQAEARGAVRVPTMVLLYRRGAVSEVKRPFVLLPWPVPGYRKTVLTP